MKNITPQPLSKSAKPSPERGLQTVPKSTSPAGGKVTDEALARDIRKQFAKVKKAEHQRRNESGKLIDLLLN